MKALIHQHDRDVRFIGLGCFLKQLHHLKHHGKVTTGHHGQPYDWR